jgi:hypothetical protein
VFYKVKEAELGTHGLEGNDQEDHGLKPAGQIV